MDRYGFNTGLGHGGLKDFVRSYCSHYTASKQALPRQAAPAQPATESVPHQP
jgi:hypothetical protein